MNQRYVSWVARQTRISFIGFEIICTIITGCALADKLLGLDLGFDWKTVWIGLGIAVWGAIIYAACAGIFRIVSGPK